MRKESREEADNGSGMRWETDRLMVLYSGDELNLTSYYHRFEECELFVKAGQWTFPSPVNTSNIRRQEI